MNLLIAPMQGHTEAAWRHAHAETFGPTALYFTPFMRFEKGNIRPRDLRDAVSPLNDNHRLVPQIIFRDITEFDTLLHSLTDAGANTVDLNLGCPFPPQCRRGRGAAIIGDATTLSLIAESIARKPEVSFSIKMRLGIDSPDEWRRTIRIIDSMPLSLLTVHPRTASQQYSGELHMHEFEALLSATRHPVVFNGGLSQPADIDRLAERYPGIAGVMAGRGLLARPSLFAEWAEGTEWSREKRIDHILRMHQMIFDHDTATLCGDTQILSKIIPFWEYLEAEIGRKTWKAIRKAKSIPAYLSAVTSIN